MTANRPLYEQISADSFLEYAFLRWVLTPAVTPGLAAHVVAQHEISVNERGYRVDYAIEGASYRIAVELDGFAYHGNRAAFTYDRLRQNDLHAASWIVIRFSYDAVRQDTARCVAQLQAMLRLDPLLARYCVPHPVIQQPEMSSDPLPGLGPAPRRSAAAPSSFFDLARACLRISPLRTCQVQDLRGGSQLRRTSAQR